MPKVTQVLVSETDDSVYYKLDNSKIIGFNISFLERHGQDLTYPRNIVEVDHELFTSTTEESMIMYSKGDLVDITESVVGKSQPTLH